MSTYPGDPLTPGVPAHRHARRLDRADPSINIPSIPSLPLSYEDAVPLLQSLNGQGIPMTPGGLAHLGVEYTSGPGRDMVYVLNHIEEKVTPIWNTMAIIPGQLAEVVVLGNHNDGELISTIPSAAAGTPELTSLCRLLSAWTFGAGDPNSGSAALQEVVKGYGALLATGWVPRRTLLIASWDAEEYGLIGSTEFGEDYAHWLKRHVVAYLNVDVAVSGSNYRVEASPSLAGLLRAASAEVRVAETGVTVLDTMLADQRATNVTTATELYVGPLGSGSDFTVFLQYLGIAAGNIGSSRKSSEPGASVSSVPCSIM